MWCTTLEWNNDITGELPAPRDDEPEHLRKNIADELSDHLHCALNRELHVTQNEQQAKQNVLSRFGNVNRIARQLWFDSMKEKIMSQRLNLAMTTLMTAVCIVLCFFVWNVSVNSREAMQTSQQLSQAIIAKLDAFSVREPAAEPRSMDWNSFQVRVVKGKKEGPPAEGFHVNLSGDILNTSKNINVSKKTGEDGLVDFGLVRSGQHSLNIGAPWGEITYRTITLGPGEKRIEEFISLPDPLVSADVELSVNLPDDLKDKNLWTVCSFRLPGREVDGTQWNQLPASRQVVISPTGQIALYHDAHYNSSPVTEEVIDEIKKRIELSKKRIEQYKQQMSSKGARPSSSRGGFIYSPALYMPSGSSRTVEAKHIATKFVSRILWTGSNAILTNVGVGVRPDVASSVAVRKQYGGASFPTTLKLEYAQSMFKGGRFGTGYYQAVSRSETNWPVEARTFTIEAGEVNHWNIVLPESLIKGIRLSLQLAEIEKNANIVTETRLPVEAKKEN